MSPELRGLRVACAHLYDDFSGSAKVFSQAISALQAAGATVHVTVGSAGESGFIRAEHPAQTVFYRFSENRVLLLLSFAAAQVLLFMSVVRACLRWKADLVYANTVLTPGAVVAGWLCRRKVIVHLHEVGLGSRVLFRMLLAIASSLSDRLVCVSQYMRGALELPQSRTVVVHNSLSPREWATAQAIGAAKVSEPGAPFVVLMACSLKWYKGIDSFLALAKALLAEPHRLPRPVRFRLVLNCRPVEWEEFAARHEVPANTTVVLRPPDIYRQYDEASLVVNLSHREGWIETFGLTLLEGMACGVPVVSPVVGGCVELFEQGTGGWRIDSRDLNAIEALVRVLASDGSRWSQAGQAARASAAQFGPDRFAENLLAVIGAVCTLR